MPTPICGAAPLGDIDGLSFKRLIPEGAGRRWRESWIYEYNFEAVFLYPPNVRGVRTDGWKYNRYPNGEGRPETHQLELYHVRGRSAR